MKYRINRSIEMRYCGVPSYVQSLKDNLSVRTCMRIYANTEHLRVLTHVRG